MCNCCQPTSTPLPVTRQMPHALVQKTSRTSLFTKKLRIKTPYRLQAQLRSKPRLQHPPRRRRQHCLPYQWVPRWMMRRKNTASNTTAIKKLSKKSYRTPSQRYFGLIPWALTCISSNFPIGCNSLAALKLLHWKTATPQKLCIDEADNV